jgi:hypothetical protein
MCLSRLCAAAVLAAWMILPAAQPSRGEGERGSIPPGESRDGSRPSEGAIKGGSAGQRNPEESPAQAERERQREATRCEALKGGLREECLRDLDAASARRPPQEPRPATPN